MRLFEHHTVELLARVGEDPKGLQEASKVLVRVSELVDAEQGGKSGKIDSRLIDAALDLVDRLSRRASPSLAHGLEGLRKDVAGFRTLTLREGLERLENQEH